MSDQFGARGATAWGLGVAVAVSATLEGTARGIAGSGVSTAVAEARAFARSRLLRSSMYLRQVSIAKSRPKLFTNET